MTAIPGYTDRELAAMLAQGANVIAANLQILQRRLLDGRYKDKHPRYAAKAKELIHLAELRLDKPQRAALDALAAKRQWEAAELTAGALEIPLRPVPKVNDGN